MVKAEKKKNPKKFTMERRRATDTIMKVMAATICAFMKDKHGLFIEADEKRYLVHNVSNQILVDSAEGFDNFQHGLLIKLKEEESGEIVNDNPELKRIVEVDL